MQLSDDDDLSIAVAPSSLIPLILLDLSATTRYLPHELHAILAQTNRSKHCVYTYERNRVIFNVLLALMVKINYSMDVLIICCRELFFSSPYLISIIAVILKCCYGNDQFICMLRLNEPMAFMLIYKRNIVERSPGIAALALMFLNRF